MMDEEVQKIIALHDRVQARESRGKLERQIWLIAARQLFRPGERQPCFVCGNFKSITQAHHVVPLTAQYDRGFEVPDCEHVWLCPNHHAMIHLFLPDADPASIRGTEERYYRRSLIHEDLSARELEKLIDLLRRSARGPL